MVEITYEKYAELLERLSRMETGFTCLCLVLIGVCLLVLGFCVYCLLKDSKHEN